MQLDTLPEDLPEPVDDSAAAHLAGIALPEAALSSTDARSVSLARLPGRAVVYAYPRTGEPGKPLPAPDWDQIPGARGCNPAIMLVPGPLRRISGTTTPN